MTKESDYCFPASCQLIQEDYQHKHAPCVGGRPCCRAPRVHTAFVFWMRHSQWVQCTLDELGNISFGGFERMFSTTLSHTQTAFTITFMDCAWYLLYNIVMTDYIRSFYNMCNTGNITLTVKICPQSEKRVCSTDEADMRPLDGQQSSNTSQVEWGIQMGRRIPFNTLMHSW